MKFSITEYDEQYTVMVYLDPEEREVYTFGFTGGACWPMEAHHDRHVSLGRVPGGFVAYTLEQWLQARTKELEALCAAYQGAEWDGSNKVGKWDPKADTLIEGLNRDLEEAVCHPTGGIFTYQDAEDYYRHTSEDEKRELLARPRQEAVAELVEDANQQGVFLREKDCDAVLDDWAESFSRKNSSASFSEIKCSQLMRAGQVLLGSSKPYGLTHKWARETIKSILGYCPKGKPNGSDMQHIWDWLDGSRKER